MQERILIGRQEKIISIPVSSGQKNTRASIDSTVSIYPAFI